MADLIEQHSIQEIFTSTGKFSKYATTLYHRGLDEYKELSAKDHDILISKIRNQTRIWDTKYQKLLEKEKKEQIAKEKLAKDELAKQRTEEAKKQVEVIENILQYTLGVDDTVDWETLKNKDPFCFKHEPHARIDFRTLDGYPLSIKMFECPLEPQKEKFFQPISFLKKLFGLKKKIMLRYEKAYQEAISDWERKKKEIEQKNDERNKELQIFINNWKKKKEEYEREQKSLNEKVDGLRDRYLQNDQEAVVEYCEIVLNNSQYPDSFPKNFELQYNSENGMLLVDYQLPALGDIPSLDSVRYVKSKDEFDEKTLSSSAQARLYESALYQIALRTIHELCEADSVHAINSVNFNGIVTDRNPATGHDETKCIMSVQVLKENFEKINLANIDPKQCFRSLKGVGSSKLSTMTAVQPLVTLDKSDNRFVEHYDVAGSLDEGMNIAAMDWEDFEHLVREIFEKEFAQNGGEVKVTKASADGGVDAIAFDPDPIRGGKIVIQAKRYTNIVGVAAVRDLYGTVVNEGATKGILVTTSDYGADSYEFAKGKPLTLLSGANLLHLLDKHGHRAKIDIQEAKKILKENSKL